MRRDRRRGKQTRDEVTAVTQVEVMVAVVRVSAPVMEVDSTSRYVLKAELLGFADRYELVRAVQRAVPVIGFWPVQLVGWGCCSGEQRKLWKKKALGWAMRRMEHFCSKSPAGPD